MDVEKHTQPHEAVNQIPMLQCASCYCGGKPRNGSKRYDGRRGNHRTIHVERQAQKTADNMKLDNFPRKSRKQFRALLVTEIGRCRAVQPRLKLPARCHVNREPIRSRSGITRGEIEKRPCRSNNRRIAKHHARAKLARADRKRQRAHRTLADRYSIEIQSRRKRPDIRKPVTFIP
jgi:hypothetical protein